MTAAQTIRYKENVALARPATQKPIFEFFKAWSPECSPELRQELPVATLEAVQRILDRCNDRTVRKPGLPRELTPPGLPQHRFAVRLGVAAISKDIVSEFTTVDMSQAVHRPEYTIGRLEAYPGLVILEHCPDLLIDDKVVAAAIYESDPALAVVLLPSAER